ncbi:conserved Plasmodium protein, unknown function [Plasmodium sp. gorilla clade G2]|uniref:conserved Plasmodium protein, unknown function n=1 Tax=Plasmodium sp. gorilla clade G2 TaxID=880535 RepID=UPI000D21DA2D|nr:conserved Plasmodium protein, unknown function [Plasmodium sp. gorilla clade G2]SOV15621.1 conserved Plasmodium protein, unknown function [Plasmodium sp. gorilla clade G2]
MWIEKDMKNSTHGGCLSKQVNNDIETLKKNNTFIYNNSRLINVHSQLKNKNENKIKKYDTNEECIEGVENTEKEMNGICTSSSIIIPKKLGKNTSERCFKDMKNIYTTNKINHLNNNKNDKQKQYAEGMILERNHTRNNVNIIYHNKMNGNRYIKGEEDFLSNTFKNNYPKKRKEANSSNISTNKIIMEESKKKQKSVHKNNKNKEYDTNEICLRNNNFLQKTRNVSINKNIRDIKENRDKLKGYGNTQYLNNTATNYNDSILNNKTTLYHEYNDIKKNDTHCEEWFDSANNDMKLNKRNYNSFDYEQNGKDEKYNEIIKIKNDEMKQNHNKVNISNNKSSSSNNNSSNKKNYLLKMKTFIQNDIPHIIKKSVDIHLSTNIDTKIQAAIEKNIMDFIENNLFSIIEKNVNDFNSHYIYDKINDCINNEIKKNIDLVYTNVKDDVNKNINDEITKNVDNLNNSLNKNITKEIEYNMEKIYIKVNENVDDKLNNEMLENITNVHENILKSINEELKRKMELVSDNINNRINENMKNELIKNINLLNNKINDNINKEMKKNIHILSRNIDVNINDQIEKTTHILLKKTSENLNDEMKNNIHILEKNIDLNFNEYMDKNLNKIYHQTKNIILFDDDIKKNISHLTQENIKQNITTNMEQNLNEVITYLHEHLLNKEKNVTDQNLKEYVEEVMSISNQKITTNLNEQIEKILHKMYEHMDKKKETHFIDIVQNIQNNMNLNTDQNIQKYMNILYENQKENIYDYITHICKQIHSSHFYEPIKEEIVQINENKFDLFIKKMDELYNIFMEKTNIYISDIIENEIKMVKERKSVQKENILLQNTPDLQTTRNSEHVHNMDVIQNIKDMIELKYEHITHNMKQIKEQMETNNKKNSYNKISTCFSTFKKQINDAIEKNTQTLLNINESAIKYMDHTHLQLNTNIHNKIEDIYKKNIISDNNIIKNVNDISYKLIDNINHKHEEYIKHMNHISKNLIEIQQLPKLINQHISSIIQKKIMKRSNHIFVYFKRFLKNRDQKMNFIINKIDKKLTYKQIYMEEKKRNRDKLKNRIKYKVIENIKKEKDKKNHINHIKEIIQKGTKCTKGIKCTKCTKYIKSPISFINKEKVKLNQKRIRKRKILGKRTCTIHQNLNKNKESPQTINNKNYVNNFLMVDHNLHLFKYYDQQKNYYTSQKRKPLYVVNYLKNENNELIEVSQYLKKTNIKKIIK